MAAMRIVPDEGRFVLTDKGREALRARETCECRPRPDGGYLVCPQCGTTWKLAINNSPVASKRSWR
jgi:hypothetical protein